MHPRQFNIPYAQKKHKHSFLTTISGIIIWEYNLPIENVNYTPLLDFKYHYIIALFWVLTYISYIDRLLSVYP